MELWKVIVIGIAEGITEWLPISSTGHLLLFDTWMPLAMSEQFKEMFFVVIQLGAILAVVTEYWQRLHPRSPKAWTLWSRILVGCLPAGGLGLLLDDFLEAHFGTPTTIAAMLILYGALFIIVERRNHSPSIGEIENLPLSTAVAIGFFQALAMIPGTSRSGATILGGLLLGVSRTAASEFSFFLALPTMLGASALKLVKFGMEFTTDELMTLALGMSTAFLVSMASIRFLMTYIRSHDFKVFGWYRIGLGILVLLNIWQY